MTHFLLNLAEEGELVEIIGALWPCYHVFLEMYHAYTKEIQFLTLHHPYYEHVMYYKELLDLPSVDCMKQVMDNILIKAEEVEKAQLKKSFFQCFYSSLEHERRFYDSVYDVDNKVINAPRVINSIISIRERLLAMPSGSWVFFDLDDTIWTADLALLRMVNNTLLEEHINGLESEYSNIRDLIWELYYCCDYKLVEDEVLVLFEELKKVGIHVLALTKRETGRSIINSLNGEIFRQDLTLIQLKKLGVHFSSIFPEGEIKLTDEVEYSYAAVKDGVVFTSHLDKGFILNKLIFKAKEHDVLLPPEIAFLDDIGDNVCNVEEALKEDEVHNIPVLAVHYKAADNLPDNGHIDYEVLNRHIRDLHEKFF